MTRTEALEEWFFPQVVRVSGLIIPAQQTAVDKYEELKNTWQENHPKFPIEEPMVCIFPGVKDGQSGYFVSTKIIYMR